MRHSVCFIWGCWEVEATFSKDYQGWWPDEMGMRLMDGPDNSFLSPDHLGFDQRTQDDLWDNAADRLQIGEGVAR